VDAVKAREIREKNDDELSQLLRERTDALVMFRMQMVTGQVDNVRAARNARKDIARIKTIQRERELQAERKAE
jgi:large subunit ribosomal protein L29